MAGTNPNQPRFLTTLTRGRITSAGDPISEKRKTLDTNRDLAGVTNKGNLASKMKRKQVSREKKNKTYEELLKTKENFKTTNRDHLSLQKTHADNVQSMKDFKLIQKRLEKKPKDTEDKLKDAQSKLEDAEGRLKYAKMGAKNYRADLADYVEGSFQNALNQIRALNPDLEFNVSGLHHLAYVSNGILIPPPSSPVHDSITRVDGEQVEEEEEVNVDNPTIMATDLQDEVPPA